ncbi:glycosyltransferase family 1 protein [Lachnospiraceae bacterium 62-26]
MIRVLHVIGAMGTGGAENMIMNIFRTIDRKKIQFDFVVHSEKRQFYDAEIEELGGKIYHVNKFVIGNGVYYLRWWNNFFKLHNEYIIVHGHINSSAFLYLSVAKKYNRITIIHSHATNDPAVSVRNYIFKFFSFFTRYTADYFFACSLSAGMDRFGEKVISSNRFEVIENGIDADKFRFNKEKREKIREELGISDNTIVVGHVGRFTRAKNHDFLIRFYKSYRELVFKSELWLVGDGELKKDIQKLAEANDLGDSVRFINVTKQVENYMQAMDVFVFPSIFEGLGIVLIEAQASGLPCIVSENIQKEADIGAGIVFQLDLRENMDKWIETVNRALEMKRKDNIKNIIESGFSIYDSAKKLESLYFSMLEYYNRKRKFK